LATEHPLLPRFFLRQLKNCMKKHFLSGETL
jgi:hypothetical protein